MWFISHVIGVLTGGAVRVGVGFGWGRSRSERDEVLVKRVLIGLVLLGACSLALLALAIAVLPSRLGPLVEQEAGVRGIELTIGGVTVDLFGGRIGLAGLRLQNERDYRDDSLAAADRVTLDATWWPLLRGELAVDGVTAYAPLLNVERLRSGHINLLDLIARVIGDRKAVEALLASAPDFHVNILEMIDGTLNLTDRDVAGQAVALQVVDLDVLAEHVTRPMARGTLGTPFTVSGNFAQPQGGSFAAVGEGNFLSGALDFTMELTLDRVGIAALGGYFMGYPIVPQGGTVSGTLTMTCRENYLTGVARLTFRDLRVTANRNDPLVRRLPSLAASKLVELQPIEDFVVPFEGDLTDPNYHLFRSIFFSAMAYASDLKHELVGRTGTAGGVIAENVKARVGDAAKGAAETTRTVVGGVVDTTRNVAAGAADTTRNVVGGVRERGGNVIDEVRRQDDEEARRLRGRRDKRSDP
jgi:hypothetical protein